MPELSVVAPVYNEANGIAEFCRRVASALDGEDYELVLVDDGSRDDSVAVITALRSNDERVRLITLSRNFGHQAALSAGLDAARGQAVVTIDSDLQDPPETIPELVAAWRGGADVVHAVRHVRPGEPRLRVAAIRLFYRLFTRLVDLPDYPGHSGDFRLLSRRALDSLVALPERNRFLRGLSAWVGYQQVVVQYERSPRYADSSKYPFRRLLRLATDGIVSFSVVPLRLASLIGILFSLVAFIAIPVVVILRLLGQYEISGVASIHILVLLIGGIQLIFLGVIGEYLARSYDEAKRRPLYVVDEQRTQG
jgi:polyisoprenyl-phosphate glycosyltransferase